MVDIRETRGALGRAFERLAEFNQRHPWSHNDHFHGWIRRHLPEHRGHALDVGCGRGEVVRLLATRFDHVDGIDVDEDMVVAATANTSGLPATTIRRADFVEVDGGYDLITMVAVLHHMDLTNALRHAARLLNDDGRLLVVGLARPHTTRDLCWDIASGVLNPIVGLVKHPRPLRTPEPPPFPVRQPTESFDEIRATARRELPGAVVRRRLFFRYTLDWVRPRG